MLFEAGGHGFDNILAGEDVALGAVVLLGDAASPIRAVGASEGDGGPLRVDDADLSSFLARVLVDQFCQNIGDGHAFLEHGESAGPEGRVGPGLGGNGTDTGLGPWDDGANGDELGLNRHSEFSCLWVEADDREGGDRWFVTIPEVA